MKDKKKLVNTLVFWGCLIVLICAVTVGIVNTYKKHQANLRYEELRNEIQDSPTDESAAEEEPQEEITIDFAAVQLQYPNAYAWIQIPDTPVDYPIMQSTAEMEDDYYLTHTIDGEENLPGAIYTQRSQNQKDLSDPVTVIYGHNMRNDSMFGTLSEYQKEEYREEHPYIYVYTPGYCYEYEIFAAVTYASDLILNRYDCNHSEEAFAAFLTSLQEDSVLPKWIKEDCSVTTQDQIIVLSTCNNNETQRFIVCGVLR